MTKLNITIIRKGGRWSSRLPRAEQQVRRIASATLKRLAQELPELATSNATLELGVVLADDAFVHELNREYRGKDKPTNVLSFPAQEDMSRALRGRVPAVPLGDVVLALETLAAEAKTQGKSFNQHLAHLLVHGILHLFGYDHLKKKDEKAMEAIEIQILGKLGLENPYGAD